MKREDMLQALPSKEDIARRAVSRRGRPHLGTSSRHSASSAPAYSWAQACAVVRTEGGSRDSLRHRREGRRDSQTSARADTPVSHVTNPPRA
jgi:hypothetical protein